jgi:hypothetical protein
VCGSEAPASRRSLTSTCTYAASACARIRSRQTFIAVATCSAGSSASVVTDCGALTITSWSPRAGRTLKRPGSASGSDSGASGVSAG